MHATITKTLPRSRIRLMELALPLICSVLFLPRLWKFGQISMGFIAWPWQFDFTEGVNLNATSMLAQGSNIYRHNGPDSFVSAPYTPLFYLLNVPFTWLMGPTFGPGRVISMLATIAIAVLLVYGVWKITSYWACGVLSGVIWLSASPVIIWAALYTQSMLAPALELAGLLWVLAHPQGRRSYIGILFFTLALYTKQTAVDAPLAVTLWLLLRNVPHGLRFGAGMAAALAVPFGAADLLTKGGIWEHTIGNQVLDWRFDRFRRMVDTFWSESWPLMLGGVGVWIMAIASLFVGRRGEGWSVRQALGSPIALVCIYFAIAIGTSVGRLGRDGATYNHLLDLLLPTCLLAGAGLGLLFKEEEKRPDRLGNSLPVAVLRTAGIVAAGTLLLVQVGTLNDPVKLYHGAWPSADIDRQMHLISNLVASTKGDIYSEDSFLLLSNGHPVIYDDGFMFVAQANAGHWDDSLFNKKLSDRSFALILIEGDLDRFTPKGLQLFYDNYSALYRDVRYSYAPKP